MSGKVITFELICGDILNDPLLLNKLSRTISSFLCVYVSNLLRENACGHSRNLLQSCTGEKRAKRKIKTIKTPDGFRWRLADTISSPGQVRGWESRNASTSQKKLSIFFKKNISSKMRLELDVDWIKINRDDVVESANHWIIQRFKFLPLFISRWWLVSPRRVVELSVSRKTDQWLAVYRSRVDVYLELCIGFSLGRLN